MENKSHAFMAGLFAILLGLGTAAAIYWFGGKGEQTRDYVVVTKQNVTGLNPQAQVRYRGIRVGKVKDIRLDPEDVRNILITIQIADNVPLTRGTVAKLAYQGVTGLGHILLEETGRDLAPLVEGGEGEAPRIAMSPSLLDELSQSGKDVVKEASEFLVAARGVLNEDNRQKFSAILNNLEATTGQMKPAVENINATMAQVRQLLNDQNIRKLSQAAGEVGPLLTESRQLLARLQATADKLDGAIGDPGGNGAAALMPRLNELSSDLSATARQLTLVLKMLEDSPQILIFGTPAPAPGPGEAGFVRPPGR